MKKRITVISACLLLILITSISFILINDSNGDTDFPHFRQAALKMCGRVFVIEDMRVSVSLVILDESRISEFSVADNIKSIVFTDGEGNEYPCEVISINEGVSEKNCIVRGLDTEMIFPVQGIYHLKSAAVTFIDGKCEVYDIGDLKISVFSRSYLKENVYGGDIQLDLVMAQSDNKYMISGVQVTVNSYNDIIILKGMDLGIEQFQLDNANMYHKECRDVDEYLNIFENACQDGEAWTDEFYSIHIGNDDIRGFGPLEIGNSDNMNTYTTFLIPLDYMADTDINDSVICFTVLISIEHENEDKIFFNQGGVIYNPLLNPSFDKKKYMRENGI